MPAAGSLFLFLSANAARHPVGIRVGIGSNARRNLFLIQLVMVLGDCRPGAPFIKAVPLHIQLCRQGAFILGDQGLDAARVFLSGFSESARLVTQTLDPSTAPWSRCFAVAVGRLRSPVLVTNASAEHPFPGLQGDRSTRDPRANQPNRHQHNHSR
jgi:hypothetical protein